MSYHPCPRPWRWRRIVEEAPANVVKHAATRHAAVIVAWDEAAAELTLTISDDGRGLPHGYRPGVGLRAMRERAEELGGKWVIDTTPSSGTRISVRLPARTGDDSAAQNSR
jgi:two-component system, NarL family, sensor kinase